MTRFLLREEQVHLPEAGYFRMAFLTSPDSPSKPFPYPNRDRLFQMMTAIFLAVALMAETRPFRKLILWKISQGSGLFQVSNGIGHVSKRYFQPAASLGTLLECTFPPLNLLLGANLNQEEKCLEVLNFFMLPELAVDTPFVQSPPWIYMGIWLVKISL